VVDIVLGVSMAPTKVRMVLVEGENADGPTVEEDNFEVACDSRPSTASSEVLSAILGTRQGAAEGGFQLLSSGVTWTDPVEAAALRDALVAHKVENVMLVSAFMAAAALAQAVGNTTHYAHTALLFVEPYTATLAVVNTADGSVADVHRRLLPEDDELAVAELVDMVAGADSLETSPDGVFVVGSGVDIPLIKPVLEAATSLHLSAPEEPEMALAHGAALASANAPLFASSTAALAYALDPGTGEVDPSLFTRQAGVIPAYLTEYRPVVTHSADINDGSTNVAYSALSDEDAEGRTIIDGEVGDITVDPRQPRRKPALLVGSIVAVIFISAVVALEIALAISIRPTVALRPSPNESFIAPAHPAPAQAAVPPQRVPAPAPVVEPRPFHPPAVAPLPAAPAPIPVIPPPVLVPIPRGPLVGGPREGPLGPGHGPFGRERPGPFGGGHGPLGGGPFGGGHGPFGGGPFGGGHGPFGGGHGPFGGGGHGGFGGGHGFGGFGGGHGFGGHR
jgi:hypothetical protein